MSTPQERPRIPLVEPFESRFGATTGDAQLVNAIAEKNERGEWEIWKRPCTHLYSTTSYLNIVGLFPYTQSGTATQVMYVGSTFGGSLKYLYFVLSGATGSVSNSLTKSLVYLGSTEYLPSSLACAIQYGPASGNPYLFILTYAPGVNWTNYNITTVASSFGFVQGVVTLDQTTYVMTADALIYGSNVGDPTTWSALNYIGARAEQGNAQYLARHHDYVVALKDFSLEFFYDAANPTGSPLAPVPNSTLLWGCRAGSTVAQFGDVIFWLAQERGGSNFVAMLSDMRHTRISTPAVNRLVGDSVGPFFSFAYRDTMGHSYYVLTDTGAGFTLVYDIEQKLWYRWSSAGYSYFPYAYASADTSNNIFLAAINNANLYTIDEDFYADAEGVPLVDIYTPDTDLGTYKTKSVVRMDFVTDLQGGNLYSRYSDDDFKSFSNFRRVDLNQKRPTLLHGGSFRRRAWNFRFRDPLPLHLKAVELDLQVGV